MNETTIKRYSSLSTKKAVKKTHVQLCSVCGDVHYKGVWYAPDSKLALLIDRDKEKILRIICPSCEMEALGIYKAALYLKDMPRDIYDDVISIVFNEAIQDYSENPQHRLLDFAETLDGYKITSTSAQMIERLGKKVQSVYNTCKIQSEYQKNIYPSQLTHAVFTTSEYF